MTIKPQPKLLEHTVSWATPLLFSCPTNDWCGADGRVSRSVVEACASSNPAPCPLLGQGLVKERLDINGQRKVLGYVRIVFIHALPSSH